MNLVPAWARPAALLGLEIQLYMAEAQSFEYSEAQIRVKLAEFRFRMEALPR